MSSTSTWPLSTVVPSAGEHTYYGSPDEPVEELLGVSEHGLPKEGDELCDGHQAHYTWIDGRWGGHQEHYTWADGLGQ